MFSPRNRGSTYIQSNQALLEDPATRSEQAVLLELFFVTQGREWKKRTNWSTNKSLGEWHGVRTVDSFVSSIDLSDNNLDGQIPSSLGLLITTKQLNMSNNNLHGVLPSSFGSMSQITMLNLSHNFITGSLPDSIHLLVNLTDLILSWNSLEGRIPDWIGDLLHLKQLDLENNYFSYMIPSTIRTCSSIKKLRLSNNQLEGEIPNCFSSFTALVELSISNNNFRGQIPSGIASLPNLKLIDFGGNNLTGVIPTKMLEMPNLRELRVHSNHMSGQLTSTSIEWNQAVSLVCLDLHDNELFGAIPEGISTIPNLGYLILSSNHFSGNLFSFLSSLVHCSIINLNLSNNDLNGTIPACIDKLIHVAELDLSNCKFSGSIPSSIAKLTRLTLLNLSDNQLYGEIPVAVIGLIPSLLTLSLSGNQLQLPTSGLGQINYISNLNLSNQGLVGSIPPAIGDLNNLQSLVLANNFFSGSVPQETTNLTKMTLFSVDGNILDYYPSVLDDKFPNLRHEFAKMSPSNRIQFKPSNRAVVELNAATSMSLTCNDADSVQVDLSNPTPVVVVEHKRNDNHAIISNKDSKDSTHDVETGPSSTTQHDDNKKEKIAQPIHDLFTVILLLVDLGFHIWITKQLYTIDNVNLFAASIIIYCFGGLFQLLTLFSWMRHKMKDACLCDVLHKLIDFYLPLQSIPLAILTVYCIVHFSSSLKMTHLLNYYKFELSLWLSLAITITSSSLYYFYNHDHLNLNCTTAFRQMNLLVLRFAEIGSRITCFGFFSSFTLGWGVLIWISAQIMISKIILHRISFHKGGSLLNELGSEFTRIFVLPTWILDTKEKSSSEVDDARSKMVKTNLMRMLEQIFLVFLMLIFSYNSLHTDNGLGMYIVTIVVTATFLLLGMLSLVAEYKGVGAVVGIVDTTGSGPVGTSGNQSNGGLEMTATEHK